MPATLDNIMELATAALMAQDYLAAEARCDQALREARAAKDWAYYARILLPLQEARRQRRMTAAEGHIRLGTGDLEGPHADWLGSFSTGCIVVTRPFTPDHAAALNTAVQTQRRYVEVLFADNTIDATTWTLRSFTNADIRATFDAPPTPWVDQWLEPQTVASLGHPSPADWFIDATEKLGDAALASLTTELASEACIDELEALLTVAPDHELLHQKLGQAARAMLLKRG